LQEIRNTGYRAKPGMACLNPGNRTIAETDHIYDSGYKPFGIWLQKPQTTNNTQQTTHNLRRATNKYICFLKRIS
jgi:hypothetical protein